LDPPQEHAMNRCWLVCFALTWMLGTSLSIGLADEGIPVVAEVSAQPLTAQVRRLIEAMEFLGEPLPSEVIQRLEKSAAGTDEAAVVREIQTILDPLCLAVVEINPESRVKSQAGPAPRELAQNGWRNFLVKVLNFAGVTAEFKMQSPNAEAMYRRTDNTPDPPVLITPGQLRDRFLDVSVFNTRPLSPTLSGLKVEYRVVQIYCRDAGQREATLQFHIGQGTQDLGFRSDLALLFESKPACQVVLHVADVDGAPTTGWFVFRDSFGRVYPSQTRRLAPDFFFHPQVYRGDGESVLLPPGKYQVSYSRGPEYVIQTREIQVPESAQSTESFQHQRWIHLKQMGWFSGDHHIHAAGCAHYDNPTKGVMPADMFRHCVGEDLNVGCCLSWGPCWYYQKGFFEGRSHDLSLPHYVLRYDVEVSGFPSSHAGHLCLLRLKEDDFPGTEKIEQWPSWDLPVLQWGKQQGGVVGFSHSGAGLACQSTELPNLEMPKFDGIGANEFIVDVVHDACDFISAADTPIIWELNIWYHTLNCGYRAKISGETDFPCVYGERVGLGRGYVKLDGPLTFDRWADAIKAGRSYVCDGLSHLIDFSVDGVEVGTETLKLDAPRTVRVSAKGAALLKTDPNDPEAVRIRGRQLYEQPYWHVERARIQGTRRVPVEVIVNGQAVQRREIEADGSLINLDFDVPIQRSSWVALRILGTAHTNPVFVEVAGAPIRGSKASAEWCRKAVDVCWESKKNGIRASEKEAAQAAYEVARKAYDQIILESPSE
jgi:hypothetical protein